MEEGSPDRKSLYRRLENRTYSFIDPISFLCFHYRLNVNNTLQDILSSNPSRTFMASNFMALSPDETDCEIDFDWDDCRVFLKYQMKSLARQRYFSMLKGRGKIGDGGDPDYMP